MKRKIYRGVGFKRKIIKEKIRIKIMTDKNLELFKRIGHFTFIERKTRRFRTERTLSPINWVKTHIARRIITKLEFNFHSGEQTLIQSAYIDEGNRIQANLIGIYWGISSKSEYLEEIVINERSTLNEKMTRIDPILNALSRCSNLTLITIKGSYLLSSALISLIIQNNSKLKEFRTKKCSIIPSSDVLPKLISLRNIKSTNWEFRAKKMIWQPERKTNNWKLVLFGRKYSRIGDNSWEYNSCDYNSWDDNSRDYNFWEDNSRDYNSWDDNCWDYNSWDDNCWDYNFWEDNSRDYNSWEDNSRDYNFWEDNSWEEDKSLVSLIDKLNQLENTSKEKYESLQLKIFTLPLYLLLFILAGSFPSHHSGA